MWIPDDRHLSPGRRNALELAGVGADEPASGHRVRTVDEHLVDHVATARERPWKNSCSCPSHASQPNGVGTTDFDHHPSATPRLDRRPIALSNAVQALDQGSSALLTNSHRPRHPPSCR